MSNLVRTQQASIQPHALSRQLTEHLDQMQASTEAAKRAMEEISEIYTYGEFKAINSLVTADMCRKVYEQSGGGLTPTEARAYMALREQYLEHMATIAVVASTKIVQDVATAPRTPETRTFWQRVIGE